MENVLIMKNTCHFFSFLFLFATNLYGQGFLANYPKEPNAKVSANYTVYVNEIPVNVYSVSTNNDVAYAHFSFSGKVKVRIHINATVNFYDLSPHSYGIVSTKSGQDISFDLDKPRKLLLQNINALKERLCILADPLEDVIPVVNGSSVVDVTTKGVDKTGSIDNLTQIKNALNGLPSGGILYFPPGRYTAGGTIPMTSNKSIYLAGGAVLQAGPIGRLTLIFDGASNVKLFGRGSIDGLGDSKRASIDGEGDWTCTLVYKNLKSVSDNCTIDGVIFKGAITWNAIVMGTTNWKVYNMKVINSSAFGNHDGWDPHSAVNMMVDNCFILGSDDCIALSILNDNMALNTTFRNNVFTNTSSGATVRIGPTVGENTSNVNVENNDHLFVGN